MSKSRSESVDINYPRRKDANGNPLCRWCQKPLSNPRRSYCDKHCRMEVNIRTSVSSLRYYVHQRDKGICAKCGLDTMKLDRILNHAQRSCYEIKYGIGSTNGCWIVRDAPSVNFVLTRLGFNEGMSLWDADHIVEVSAGGDSGLDNIQTLCVPCHKAKTKQMHAERKAARTGVKPKPPVQETQLTMI